ncbi:ribonuclease H-like domain-containing protein [Tanacetum coccineum]
MIRTINNIIQTLLFQVHLPPNYWTEALNMAVYLVNILPSRAIENEVPFTCLFGTKPDYSLLCVFGCLCYPHLDNEHKLGARATPSIYLRHASNHRGYRCLDLNTNKIIISRHVTFDETVFPFGFMTSKASPSYDFLDDSSNIISNIIKQTPTPITTSLTTSPQPNTPITINHTNEPSSPTPGPRSPAQPETSIFPTAESIPHINSPLPTPVTSPIHQQTIPVFVSQDPPTTTVNLNLVSFLADGTLSRYKARLVVNGSTQIEGIDVDETFSPVVKPDTIQTILIYMHQPPGFRDPTHPDHVCLLQRSLYGLKQAPRAWFERFAAYITRVGFSHNRCGSSLFIYRQEMDTAYLLLYVDDIVLIASSELLLQQIIASLHQEFSMTDLGSLNYFLGISVTRDSTGIRTLVDIESKLRDDGDLVADPTLYRSLAGTLQYLTFTRPDISYVVQQVCLHMHDPREPHFFALKRILRYVWGTLDYGLQLFSSSTTSLVSYSDADWVGCPTTRRSTSGYCVFLGNNLLSWSYKRQPTLSRSSVEAEYWGVANAVAETCWLQNVLCELHTPLSSATLVYCDNISVVYLSSNPVQHQRTKHIEIDIHFVRDLAAAG